MMGHCYDKHMAKLVEEGKISMQLVDDAVKRVLRIKFRLGLFDNPYTPTSTEKERFLLPQSLAIAEKLAEETIVLLKNENKVLPLANGNKPTIAVMGPLVENCAELLGHGMDMDMQKMSSPSKRRWMQNLQARLN